MEDCFFLKTVCPPFVDALCVLKDDLTYQCMLRFLGHGQPTASKMSFQKYHPKSSKDVEQLFFKIHSGSISQHIFPSFLFSLARRLIIIDWTSLPSETFLSGWTSRRSSWCFGFGEVGDSGLSAEMLVVVTPLRLATSKWENMRICLSNNMWLKAT